MPTMSMMKRITTLVVEMTIMEAIQVKLLIASINNIKLDRT